MVMKHPSCRRLYDYWNELRGGRAAPESSSIEPGAIRHVLADTFTLGIDIFGGHPFHIAGTRICAAFGRELKAQSFVDLWQARDREMLCDIMTNVMRESVGIVASASSSNDEDAPLEFEVLLLPLKQDGRMDRRILGGLAPTSMPYWFGVRTAGPLVLGPHRYLRPHALAQSMRRRLTDAARDSRIAHGFVVYQGGRS
jgi:hypothetical protein